MALKNLPKICPSCGKRLSVQAMHCNGCDTHIEGDYNLPVMMQLSAPDQQFVLDFVKSSGSLKEMAAEYGVTYPTVRLRLDKIIQKVRLGEEYAGDPYVALIKRLALNEKLDFDTAKLLITEYKKLKGGT